MMGTLDIMVHIVLAFTLIAIAISSAIIVACVAFASVYEVYKGLSHRRNK